MAGPGISLEVTDEVDGADNIDIIDVIGRKDDTIAGSSIMSALKRLEAAVGVAENASVVEGEVTGANLFSGTATSTETGADLVTISVPGGEFRKVHSLKVDLTNLDGQRRIYYRLYTEINGTERKIDEGYERVANVPGGWWIISSTVALANDLRLELQSTDSDDTLVDVGYEAVIEVMG